MEFEWDDNKNESNYEKHHVRFDDAMFIFEGPLLEREDIRTYDGETRFVAFGYVDGRLLAVVYTWRGNICRIISARKANKREQRAYRSAFLEQPPDTTG